MLDIVIAVGVTVAVVAPTSLVLGGYLAYRFAAKVKGAGEAAAKAVQAELTK